MDRVILESLLADINGCTFATVDTETEPSPGIVKQTVGMRVILFTNKKSSGYDNMVRRRLIEAGKNPDNFSLGDLPWGTRVPNSPLIEHKGKTYLQCVLLAEGQSRYFIKTNMSEVNPEDLHLPSSRTNQGLPEDDEVHVRCYNIENIVRIAAMNENLVADKPRRAILKIGFTN